MKFLPIPIAMAKVHTGLNRFFDPEAFPFVTAQGKHTNLQLKSGQLTDAYLFYGVVEDLSRKVMLDEDDTSTNLDPLRDCPICADVSRGQQLEDGECWWRMPKSLQFWNANCRFPSWCLIYAILFI